MLSIPFGHLWCSNRSLHDITFENCTFEGICKPCDLKCPAEEPLKLLNMKNCSVSPREGYENINFIEGENILAVNLQNVTFNNFTSPNIVCTPEAVVNTENNK
jgi:hypothetical protein